MTPILSLGELGNHQLTTCAYLSTRRISCFVGLFIELWKVTKVQDVSFDFENKFLGVFPRVKLDDKKDYTDSGTKEYDRKAFKYLGMAFFPLAFCYCIYSVIYNEHKVEGKILILCINMFILVRAGTALSLVLVMDSS
jgi:hypothetical protein